MASLKDISKSEKSIIVLLFCGFLAGLFFAGILYFFIFPILSFENEKENLTEEVHKFIEEGEALPSVDGGTRRQMTISIPTPEPGDLPPAEGVAVPVDTAPIGGVVYRTFEIEGKDGQFSPSIIVINEGDSIILRLNSVDGDYDMFFPDFGVFIPAFDNESRRHIFHAYPYGEYEFFCLDACDGDPRGMLVVNPRG